MSGNYVSPWPLIMSLAGNYHIALLGIMSLFRAIYAIEGEQYCDSLTDQILS